MLTVCEGPDTQIVHKDDIHLHYKASYSHYHVKYLENKYYIAHFDCPLKKKHDCNHVLCKDYEITDSYTVPIAKVEAYVTSVEKTKLLFMLNQPFMIIYNFSKYGFELDVKTLMSLSKKCNSYELEIFWHWDRDFFWVSCVCGDCREIFI